MTFNPPFCAKSSISGFLSPERMGSPYRTWPSREETYRTRRSHLVRGEEVMVKNRSWWQFRDLLIKAEMGLVLRGKKICLSEPWREDEVSI